MKIPRLCYIVASTPRSGSSLLCEALGSTGIAGNPDEAFGPDFTGPWWDRWGLNRDCEMAAYISAAIAYGTTPNGWYGVKIHWMHLPVLAHAMRQSRPFERVLDRLFPSARYINIIRDDRRAQALSWYRAIATDEWCQDGDRTSVPEPPDPDLASILALEANIDRQQRGWDGYFREREITPHVVRYESIDTAYRSELERALAFLGLNPDAAQALEEPTLQRQANETTKRWREQIDRLERGPRHVAHAS